MFLPKRILIVEDDNDLVILLTKVLTNAGYEVQSLPDGSPIVENQYEKPDLFLLDKEMKLMDGIAICKYLKVKKELSTIPIVMMSADYSAEGKAIKNGASCFFRKPLPIDKLLMAIRTLV